MKLCCNTQVGSGDSNHLGLLVQVARTGRPVVVSTGMCDMAWVRRMVDTLGRHTDKVTLCTLCSVTSGI